MKRVTTKSNDPSLIAFEVLGLATGDYPKPTKPKQKAKNPAAVALGRLGGLKGGKARAKALTPAQRSEIARKAGKNRWKNHVPK
jgi:hypothetical protein